MSFVPIHNHSHFSALDGLATPDEIASRCLDLEYEACGLSDHGNVAGHIDFDSAMRDKSLKPIFACELYHGLKSSFKGSERDQAHFLAGALDDEGLRNLWRLVDESASYFRYVPRVNWESLKRHSEGLFATSACIQGLVSKEAQEGRFDALNQYLEIFKDNFYIELHTYPGEDQERVNNLLLQVAEEKGIPTLIATDAHFASPTQYDIHDAYIAMQTQDAVTVPIEDRKMWHPKSLYIQSEDEIRENLKYLPDSVIDEAFANSGALAESVDANLPGIKRHLPTFVISECPWLDKEEELPAKTLLDLVEQGVNNRYDNPDKEVWDRAAKELEVLNAANMEHYFLQAWDLLQFCRKEGIKKGPGRGSVAGSLVAYALGITDIEPLKNNLIFERFYNVGREAGFPDIDTDFPKGDREKVCSYLKKRWGENNVRHIGTTIRMKPKSACDKTYKACGVSYKEKEEAKAIIDLTPDLNILTLDSIGWSSDLTPGKTVYVWDEVGDQLTEWVMKRSPDDQKRLIRWLELVGTLVGRVSTYGVHASGIVVADCDLRAELPSSSRGKEKERVLATTFSMDDVDKRGFVKQDILGLNTLDRINEWENLAGEEIEWDELHKKEFPEEMWELLDEGFTLGVFQIERGYARQLCKSFKPRSIADLAAILALNRPGPIRAGVPDDFIARKNGEQEVSFDHPLLEEILAPTYGLWLYQEQVINFFTLIGYDLSDSDAVRKILGKKKPEALEALLKGEGEWEGKGYLETAERVLGSREVALDIWNKVSGFAAYSFNASHAIAYGTITLCTLYAKWKKSAEFYLACLRHDPGDYVAEFVGEARRMGIKVLPPDILKSDMDMNLVNGEILYGLGNIKGVKTAAKFVLELREKTNISTPDLFYAALENEQTYWEDADKETRGRSPRQRFRANLIQVLEDAGVWDNHVERTISETKKQKLEQELLSVVLSDTSEDLLREALNGHEFPSYDEVDKEEVVELPGVISTIRATKTKAEGKPMGIVTIQYSGDELEFVVFPSQWKSYNFLWKERTPGIFSVQKTDRGVHLESARKLW